MPTRYDAAVQLDITLEMARRHGVPSQMSQSELDELDQHPPAWLVQSRVNRTGKKPVWVELKCAICGFSEHARPKKWWPEFTQLVCFDHELAELPSQVNPAATREFTYGVGSRFTGIVETVPQAE